MALTITSLVMRGDQTAHTTRLRVDHDALAPYPWRVSWPRPDPRPGDHRHDAGRCLGPRS
ncbi:MAG TPA: hypothetical protein VMU94_07165 [Streptosporangiaceae bacterium]|nr:hypothetical protein [Streptosporangiaceae bacterium]